MFKRILLAMTFAATLGVASLCVSDQAEARRWGWYRPYAAYYGPPAYYSYGTPYRAYYGGYYARPYYYGAPAYYAGPRVSVRIGPWWR